MDLKTESQIIADILDFSRGVTMYFFSKLEGTDLKESFELNGVKLNSALWIIGHITWGQDSLVNEHVFGEQTKYPWLFKNFGTGSTGEFEEDLPTEDEILGLFHQMHKECIEKIRILDDNLLDDEIDFYGMKSNKRKLLYHSISHEGTHQGHLGWVCKLKGITTI